MPFCITTLALSKSSMFWKVRAMPQTGDLIGSDTGAGATTLKMDAAGGRVIDAADQIEDPRGFPAPLGPMMVKILPFSTSKETPVLPL